MRRGPDRAARLAARDPRASGERLCARFCRAAGCRAQAAVGAQGRRPAAPRRDRRRRAAADRRVAARRALGDDARRTDRLPVATPRAARSAIIARRSGAVMRRQTASRQPGPLGRAAVRRAAARDGRLRPLLHWPFRGQPAFFERDSFFRLWLSQLGLVAAASLAASARRGACGLCDPPAGRDFRPIVNALATVGQTFPPAAVLALAVPVLGFGPARRSSRCSSTACCRSSRTPSPGSKACRARARRGRRHGAVPLAAAARCRTAARRAGHPRGGPGLGDDRDRHRDDRLDGRRPDPRHADLRWLAADKLPFVLQGAVLVALFAILTDMVFARLERRLRPARQG